MLFFGRKTLELRVKGSFAFAIFSKGQLWYKILYNIIYISNYYYYCYVVLLVTIVFVKFVRNLAKEAKENSLRIQTIVFFSRH